MALSIIIAPEQPRTSSMRNLPPPAGAATVQPVTARSNFDDPFDQRIHDYLLERVGFAIKSWTMLNAITAGVNPRSESERRRVVKALLQRLKLLLHSGVVRRAGRVHVYLHVEGQPAPLSPFTRNIPRRRRRVRSRQVSPKPPASVTTAHIPTTTSAQSCPPNQPSNTTALQAISAAPQATTANAELPKSKSAEAIMVEGAVPFVTQSSKLDGTALAASIKRRIASIKAGSRLAKHRWSRRKILTGYIQGQRCWRGRRVLMADGVGAEVMVARRGKVLVFADRRASILDTRFRVVEAGQLVVCKLPEAVRLGARKRGMKERPSEVKQAAARRNGARPVRPGSRPRGRPRTKRLTPERASHSARLEGPLQHRR
jgi:hypothetical protein